MRSGRTAEESGYLVLSAETLLNVFHAFAYGTPQTRKVITVSGNAVNRKKILRVRNGTTADEIFANCDGFAVQPGAVIEGGIMRGKAITLDECATLSTNVLVALPKRPLDVDGDCIRCGRCVRVCPMHLAPLKLASQSKDGQIEDCLAIGLDACIECGCCAYVCLGKVNLLRHIRAAKAQAHPPPGEQPQASPSTKEGAENTKARRLETAEPSSAATGEPPAPQQPAVRTELPADRNGPARKQKPRLQHRRRHRKLPIPSKHSTTHSVPLPKRTDSRRQTGRRRIKGLTCGFAFTKSRALSERLAALNRFSARERHTSDAGRGRAGPNSSLRSLNVCQRRK